MLGLERQGRQLAGREGVEWVEFWPWLGEYVDLTTQLGLDMLENHLEEKMREAREIIDTENQDELVDELEASLVITKGSEREEIMTDIVIEWKQNIARFESEAFKAGIASKEFWLVQGWGGDIQ